MLSTFLIQILVLAVLLLAGYVLRVKVRLFQRLFLPAAVIGGGLGLLLGPALLGDRAVVPIPEDWLSTYAKLPGVLITPVMAASVLGLSVPGRAVFITSVGRQMCYTLAFYFSQFALGSVVALVFVPKLYPTFGLELFSGFSGGHGTAGIYGQALQALGVDWWTRGQAVALVSATFGLVFGVTGGIFLINWAGRRGETTLLASPDRLPREVLTGLVKDATKRKPVGASVTSPDVLDPVSYTFALIAVPSLLGIGAAEIIETVPSLSVLESVGAFAWALVFSAILWLIVSKAGYGWILDVHTKNRVAGVLVDFLVVAALVSMPIRELSGYTLPIAVLLLAGAVGAVVMFYVGKRMLPDHWVERSVMTFGQCTGVTATGLLLLRVVDPDFKTPAVSAWGLSYAVVFPLALVYLGVGTSIMAEYGPVVFGGISLALSAAGFVLASLFPKVSS
jgi:ESS family glutamate:Na+ symporter